MALKFRKKIVLFAIEGTYGTDAAPNSVVNAILTKGLTIQPMEGETVNRDVDRPTLGNDLAIHVGTHVVAEFDVEFAGSGTADTPPAWGALMRACGMAQTINLAVDVQYDPVSTNEESGTMYIHLDGQKHAMVGARGTWSIAIDPKGVPYLKFRFTGLWVDPASVADPVPNFGMFMTPLAVTNTNTPTFTLHGNTFNLLGLTLDQANDVVYRNVVGSESVQIVDRTPAGKVTIEAPPLSTFNVFTTAKANTTGALQLVHGTVAGNIVQVDAPTVQLLSPNYGESDGIRTVEMDLSLIPSSVGDDEIKITTK